MLILPPISGHLLFLQIWPGLVGTGRETLGPENSVVRR
jgi:hypothetical protein